MLPHEAGKRIRRDTLLSPLPSFVSMRRLKLGLSIFQLAVVDYPVLRLLFPASAAIAPRARRNVGRNAMYRR